MNKVIGCIDGTETSATVCEYAVWAASRMSAPLEFLHVIDRHPEVASITDFSGNLAMDAQEDLLKQLSELDSQRSKVAQEHGRLLIDAARQRASELGITAAEGRQRHGALVDTLSELEHDIRLVVVGRRHGSDASGQPVLNHRLERVIRGLQRPILATSATYRQPERFMIAFDGSPTGRKTVTRVAGSPLLSGLPCHIVTAGSDSESVRTQLRWASDELTTQGFDVTTACREGDPETVLSDYAREHDVTLLVMGAYGHSRIRQLIIGSTTTTLLRTSPVPVLVLR